MRQLVSLLMCVVLVGCSNMMPRTNLTTSKPLGFENYDEVQNKASKIVPHVTTEKDLKDLGFDAEVVPNTQIIREPKRTLLRDGERVETLPEAAQLCVIEGERCKGYRFYLHEEDTEGEGNLLLRLVRIKVIDVTTGWEAILYVYLIPSFNARPVPLHQLRDDEWVVVYVVGPEGTPNIDEKKTRTNLLGPFQTLDQVFPGLPNANTN